jgi:hypothetical protein
LSIDGREHKLNTGRRRIIQVFNYLRALDLYRNPVKRLLRDQFWTMHFRNIPDHPSIRLGPFGPDSTEAGSVLWVRRPDERPAPNPPETIAGWLERGWDDPNSSLKVRASRDEGDAKGQTVVVRFDDDLRRNEALVTWKLLWNDWAALEHPAREAVGVYERLYALHGKLDREGARFELILGDGMLSWKHPDGIEINHPVLLQSVQLDFKPERREFSVVNSGREAELYTSLFNAMAAVDGRAIGRWWDEKKRGDAQPLGGTETSEFLEGLVHLLSPPGMFQEVAVTTSASESPRITCDRVLFLRERSLGMSFAINNAIHDLETRDDLPESLLAIVDAQTLHGGDGSWEYGKKNSKEAKEILSAKHSNAEQTRIVERLDEHDSVLVQGPPGTGKTHTIANLIGLLLARGESVLVTSHTTKALRVLREKVVEPLQILCVSVLDGDVQNRADLEASVQAIDDRLSNSDCGLLIAKAEKLASKRAYLAGELESRNADLLKARFDEYRNIVVAGAGYSSVEAACTVARGIGRHDWIPGGVSPGAPLPVSAEDLAELYRMAHAVSVHNEMDLRLSLPDRGTLPSPDEFVKIMDEQNNLAGVDVTTGSQFWDASPRIADAIRFEGLRHRIAQALSKIDDRHHWQLEAISAGRQGGPHREVWDELIDRIERADVAATDASVHLIRHAPTLPSTPSLLRQKEIILELERHLYQGRRLGAFDLLFRPAWRSLIANARVNGQQPTKGEHFRALAALASRALSNLGLMNRWDRQMASLGAPHSDQFPYDNPASVAKQFIPSIRDFLSWHAKQWRPIEAELKSLGFRWQDFLAELATNLAVPSELLRLRDAAQNQIPEVLMARAYLARRLKLEADLAALMGALTVVDGNRPAQVVERLKTSVKAADSAAYREHYSRLVEQDDLRRKLNLRDELRVARDDHGPEGCDRRRSRTG